jgi:tetratricopeptide (TPR) repeat protein
MTDDVAQDEAPPPAADPLIGSVIAERYRVDAVLGEGGMGTVYRCHHLALERDVAVKLLKPELLEDDQVSARFDREARSASRLEHPNVMQVLDFGSWNRGDDGRPAKFMVLQLLEGWELADYLGEPMTPERVIEIALQIVRGLEHAHQRGIVHRDLKPENVFVTADHDGEECLKIVDFGLAKVLSGSGAQQKLTRTGMVFGTPQYMSPEQATGMESDERTDIYALGIMMWELLVGRPPFDGDDVISIIRRQVSTPLPNDELPPETPPTLRSLIERMTEKEVDVRMGTASEVRAALEAMADGADTLAPHAVPTLPPLAAVESGPMDASEVRAATLDPAPAASPLARIPKPALIGGAAAFLGLIVLVAALNSGDDDPEAAASADAPSAAIAAPGKMSTAEVFGGSNGASVADLADLDAKIEALEDAAALTKIDTLIKEHPEDARLHARKGRVLARQEGKQRASVEAFDRALELAPDLIDDDATYRALLDVLRDPGVKSDAVELAIARLGDRGAAFLVELVNRDDDVLSYEDRQRVLASLDAHPDQAANVDRRLNLALDLWQAGKTAHGCRVYAKTLDAIEADPHAFYVGSLHKSRAPKPSGPETKTDCEGLNTRRVKLAIELSGKFPEADKAREVPAAFAGKKTKRGRKSSGGSSSGQKKRRFKIFQ